VGREEEVATTDTCIETRLRLVVSCVIQVYVSDQEANWFRGSGLPWSPIHRGHSEG
jgi:hypothetical protein